MKAFEKIIERLEEYEENNTQNRSDDDYELGQFSACETAIEIVNQVASEYKPHVIAEIKIDKEDLEEIASEKVKELREQMSDNWIPVSSGKLPEEHDSIFAQYKGTDKWNDAMFEKISETVNVTVSDKKGKGTTTHAHTVDGKWVCDLLKCNKSYRIIAWQPLPEPYQSKGE